MLAGTVRQIFPLFFVLFGGGSVLVTAKGRTNSTREGTITI